MIDLSFLNDSEFYALIIYLCSVSLIGWFMSWGVSFITSLFIKIIKKGV